MTPAARVNGDARGDCPLPDIAEVGIPSSSSGLGGHRMNFFARQAVAYRNKIAQGCGSLLGIVTGLIADRVLTDDEVRFLSAWLDQHDEIATHWPGDVLHARIKAALADGRIDEEERAHLVKTIEQIVGGSLERLSERGAVNQLAFDDPGDLQFSGSHFCLTGDFVFGPRAKCEAEISGRGGLVGKGITKRLRYLVVGSLGSDEWKHGSFGTKIEKAIAYRRSGVPISIVREDHWTEVIRRPG